MPETNITLSALNNLIREKISSGFPMPIWITAEILEMQVNRTGHCYMELIEKSGDDDAIIAKSRATIWAYKFNMLKPFFETTTGTTLRSGIKVLVKAEVSFHEVYGLSLNISDIDPSFTLGDMALKRKEVIRKLTEAGVMDMNRELPFPSVPQAIAVISSDTAAGYGDFMDTLTNNSYNFSFQTMLFSARMQGEQADRSIIKALESIYNHETDFDIVVIIRGGGSQADLDCFNSYDLCLNIAQFPLPILTGIGHDRDESIADLVAHRSLKTPTAVAEFLVDLLLEFNAYLDDLHNRFLARTANILQEEKTRIELHAKTLHHSIQQYLTEEEFVIKDFRNRLSTSSKQCISDGKDLVIRSTGQLQFQWRSLIGRIRRDLDVYDGKHRSAVRNILSLESDNLRNWEKHLDLVRPERVLARGYSITYANGKPVKSIKELEPGDQISTHLNDGTIESEVKTTKKK